MAKFLTMLRRGFQGMGHMFTNEGRKEMAEGFNQAVTKDINRLATGVGNFAGNVLSGVGQGIVGPLGDMLFKLGESQRAYDKQERELEYLRSLPITQMQNLKDAGLNPNLIYGNGAAGAAGNYTPNEDKGQGMQIMDTVNNALGQIMSTIGGFQQIKAVSAGIEKTKEAVRHAKLANDYQQYYNRLMGIYGLDEDGHEYVKNPTINLVPDSELTDKGKFGSYNPDQGGDDQVTGGPLMAKVYQGLRRLVRDNDMTNVEYHNAVRFLDNMSQGELDVLHKQKKLLKWQAKFQEEQYNRLLNTWDPWVLELIDIGENLAGTAATVATRGIAGKHGMLGQLHDETGYKSSPKGYYTYGRSFR